MIRIRLSALVSLSLLLSAPAWGRDDLCLFRNGLFLCDTAHDGGTAEMRFRYGQAGDVPFLIPLSAGAPAMPCVFRGQHFLCTGVNASFTVPAGAQPLMGDVDGDLADGGQVDPCYRAGKNWTCQVWAEPVGFLTVSWTFGSGSGTGLLGDVDGDGTADSCMSHQGQFSCQAWQSQTGQYLRVGFDLRQEYTQLGGGTPLLGDMDGDGRADPCLYFHGHLICGLFPVTGGRPTQTLELYFGVAGDIPVMGDVDGL